MKKLTLALVGAACSALFLVAISSTARGPAEQAVAEKAAAGARPPVFPLDVEPLWQNGELWGFAFLISVTPFDVGLPPQLLMVDSGSSTLAFCNASLAQGQSSSIATLRHPHVDLISCNTYGSGDPPEYYWVRSGDPRARARVTAPSLAPTRQFSRPEETHVALCHQLSPPPLSHNRTGLYVLERG